MMRFSTLGLLVAALFLAGLFAKPVAGLLDRYDACTSQQEETGIVTTWSPWSGCRATILGTEVQVGP